MTPRSKKLLALETENTSTRTPGQPASQRHSSSPSCFRALGTGEDHLSPEMPDRSLVTPQSLQIRRHSDGRITGEVIETSESWSRGKSQTTGEKSRAVCELLRQAQLDTA